MKIKNLFTIILCLTLSFSGYSKSNDEKSDIEKASKQLLEAIKKLETYKDELVKERDSLKLQLEEKRSQQQPQPSKEAKYQSDSNPDSDSDSDSDSDFDSNTLNGLISQMQECLQNPYDKDAVNKLIAAANEVPERERSEKFNKLLETVKDYRFTMFELARVFVEYDENYRGLNYDNPLEKLQEAGETEFIDQIEYTKEILNDFIKKNGILDPETKKELKTSCPEAFKDYEFRKY